MKQDFQDLLKPEIISKVSGLALIARLVVDGFLSGFNHSRRLGPGMEFSQYRGYQAGDDLRLLDWKMLARSGRYYIKQSEVETNISVKFILDTSRSMLHRDAGLSKMDYVRVLVASLAYLSFGQGDAVGLFGLNDEKLLSVFPSGQKQHYNRLLLELIKIENKGKWPRDAKDLLQLQNRNQKEIILFVTDLYEHDNELTAQIRGLKTSRNEVLVLHIMAQNELEFDFQGNLTFEDLETGNHLKVSAREAREAYLKSLNQMLKDLKENLHESGISYHLFRTDEPIEESLQLFLKQRNRLL